MSPAWRCACLLGGAVAWLPWSSAEGQSYRLRLDAGAQGVSYRGVTSDSILASDAVVGPTGGFRTPDGFAVTCPSNGTYCFFFRPGPEIRGGPLVSSTDLTLWGLGVRGLSVKVNGRVGADLGDEDAWPGTDPAVQLIEAYAEYSYRAVRARAGRQLLPSRLGVVGFDGGRVTAQADRYGLDGDAYVGLGLARATAIPVTSPVLDPLEDVFQPGSRQILAGAALGWSGRAGDVRVEYQRQIDRDTRNFVSEQAALSLSFRPAARWTLTAGVDYDLANTWFGNADVLLRYTDRWVTVTGGLRQYRPHFDLWTIWGAFSPVPYHAANAALWIRPIRNLELQGRWEQYAYSETETETPLVQVDDDGWRMGVGAVYHLGPSWTLDAGYHEESGPGASSHGFDGSVTFTPTAELSLSAYGSTLERPLEFRFNEASVDAFGVDAEWSPTERWRIGAGAARYAEDHERPDAAAFDWNQTRLHARVTLFLRSGGGTLPLPPALRTPPRAESR